MPAIMIQGTGSNVGKSLLVAGLCRAAKNRGINVHPFKPQNMSNNAAVTIDDGEIGRAQALQALACGLEPHTDMNPILLKPESEKGAAVIIQGQHDQTCKAREYKALKPALMKPVLESFERLKSQSDLVIVEGAGSPAEVNLRKDDIANMGFAVATQTPVILVGDIDRGGVIAQMVGTKAVLEPCDETMVKGFIINKFRGDISLFDDGYAMIEAYTNWEGLGVLPYFDDAHKLPAEDALDLRHKRGTGAIRIGALRFSRIANFDDLDPLAAEPDVDLQIIEAGQIIPADLDLVILPGSKSTMADLEFLQNQGWDIDLAAHIRRGGSVLGICGGYQMLGKLIHDPDGREGNQIQVSGLGYLDIETTMQAHKTLTRIEAKDARSGIKMQGYEIHIGQSEGPDRAHPFAYINGRAEGATTQNGQIMGTYLHGIFAEDAFRRAFLKAFGEVRGVMDYQDQLEQVLDRLASHIEDYLDMDQILKIAGL